MGQYTTTPIPKLKTLFKYWFEKAYWHRPSVILFDNMDKLMAAEEEVSAGFSIFHYVSYGVFVACGVISPATYYRAIHPCLWFIVQDCATRLYWNHLPGISGVQGSSAPEPDGHSHVQADYQSETSRKR